MIANVAQAPHLDFVDYDASLFGCQVCHLAHQRSDCLKFSTGPFGGQVRNHADQGQLVQGLLDFDVSMLDCQMTVREFGHWYSHWLWASHDAKHAIGRGQAHCEALCFDANLLKRAMCLCYRLPYVLKI